MDNLSDGQREVIALALLHGWRWKASNPDCLPMLTNIAPGKRYCAECSKTRPAAHFSRNSPTLCLTCYRRKARLAWHKKHSRS